MADSNSAAKAADVIIVGAGLAGLVAAYEAVKSGLKVLVLDQENRKNFGGQAFWSLGGLFYVGSPEQKLMGQRQRRTRLARLGKLRGLR